MRRIFSRGLNYHGQCGLGKDVKYSIEKFSELPIQLPITNVYTNLANNFALNEDCKKVYYWGFNWDMRSFFRTSMLYNLSPKIMWMMKKMWPPLKTYPCSPSILHNFEDKLVDIQVGGGHCIFLDENGFSYIIGENSSGQLGTEDLSPIYKVEKIILEENILISKISAGFQHSLFLSQSGEVFGCGKSDKYQLGEQYMQRYKASDSYKDLGLGIKNLNLKNIEGRIIDVKAGKYHSAFLTDSGNVYVIGINRFGQLGQSNLNLARVPHPLKLEFPCDVKIVKLEIGDNHNLMLAEDGTLWANGDNSVGQVDGNLDNFLYYHCTPKQVNVPGIENNKIVKLYAKSNRSAAKLSNGDFYYWGGYSYHNEYPLNNQPRYEGFNLMNNEKGLPENPKIMDIALGFLHDIVLIE